MASNAQTTNWFDANGASYAQFRPEYPAGLSQLLASICASHRLAVDVGCGNGQLTTLLADHFDAVIGLDPSAEQIAHATPHNRVSYLTAPAERLPLPDGQADLITAAQAAHWFDLPPFYAEVRRIAAPDAVIALISYGVMRFRDEALDDRFARFYRDEIGPFWPPERKLVDDGYAGMDFPFAERAAPELSIERDWALGEFLGYLSTWSAVRRAKEAGRDDIVNAFVDDMTRLWDKPDDRHHVRWPINMRLGVVSEPVG